MRHSKIITSALFGFLVVAGCITNQNLSRSPAAKIEPSQLTPGTTDGRIAYLTARLLEDYHYSQQPLDAEMSEKFFDDYVGGSGGLDSRHENFLQSDIAGFSRWRTNLDTLTVNGKGVADLTPALQIFQRLTERLEQHTAYVDDLLKEDKFKFTGSDSYFFDRRDEPFPKDLEEAKELWREHLRYEYLQEKLSHELSPTNSDIVLPLSKSADAEIREKLVRHYDWILHYYTNWDSTDVLQYYLESLAHAYDPHSDYLNNAHAQDFSIGMSLSLFGIGAKLTEDDGYCTISELIRGGPADKSKLLNEKDRIVAVAQSNLPPVDVVDMDLGRVVQLIRGPKGTEVRLTISPAEDRAARRVLTLVRDEIKLEDQEAKAQLIESPDGKGGTNRLGVIDLPSFYAPIDLSGNTGHTKPKYTSVDVAKLVKKLEQEKVSGIILDLRSNPGGSLEEAVKFTGLFVKPGPVVLARDSNGGISVDGNSDTKVLYDGPLVVLINRLSASAAEIAAAALQDYGRALVVGDISTFGKGTVQDLHQLYPFIWSSSKSVTNDPGTVKISIRKFYRVSGASTQLKGVVPDIVLPDIFNYSTEFGFGETTLENPLPWDTIPSADYDKLNLVYDKLNLVQPYLAQLSRRSDARVATNQDFIYVRQDIEQFQKLQIDKSATLNEREALEERQTNQARQKARDAERAARKSPDMTIYEITPENADHPGLPTPTIQTNETTVATSTNSMSATAEKKSPPSIIDPMLGETENILEDYISLLSKNTTLIANH